MLQKKHILKVVKCFEAINTHFRKNETMNKKQYGAIVKKQFRKELKKEVKEDVAKD